ncbi:hypothetical protein SERLA73DRAFT_188890 [Serpula lacrymans var. lacrymans S7.3]|uniref:Uncharacterized protein n=2 Tax=Serpula lacrymans var. lacrymans TaxID=341189 RepID=F8QD41_SERL3|nr:uncharacterized protein SERLADRAFT_479499 [Serpula lacrymans var. lacrymans S7.9]EGN93787.1 hypothetical protein SERLA73DRAFT_188890 [Serpula lacrymans var. lacrymans S7.3]EGO19159.1 hypothetical protein SERLADRAFT_479499 [Serpula lacrymans var. lacrymans S7.9]
MSLKEDLSSSKLERPNFPIWAVHLDPPQPTTPSLTPEKRYTEQRHRQYLVLQAETKKN